MSILGVFLLVLALFYYAILLLAHPISDAINNRISKQDSPSSFVLKLKEGLLFLENDKVRMISGHVAIILALWNFFAPDFGSIYGGITLIGALIPATMLFFDAFILVPQLFDWIPYEPLKVQLNIVLEKISPIAGWLTLVVAVLHSILYRIPFF